METVPEDNITNSESNKLEPKATTQEDTEMQYNDNISENDTDTAGTI